MNHVTLFTLGFISYWIVPVLLAVLMGAVLRSAVGDELMNMYADTSDIIQYLLIAGLTYLSFVAGDTLARFGRTSNAVSRPVSRTILNLLVVLASLVAAGAMFEGRDILLKGSYIYESANPLARGTIAASCVFLFLLAIIYIVQSAPASLKSLLFNRFMLIFWPVNLVLFLSGTRLYFISFLLMLMVYWTNFRAPVRLFRFFLMLLAPVLLMGLVGAYRLSGGDHSILVNLVAEPMFTSYSLVAFLQTKHFFLWNFPVYLASDLLNLIPSALFPAKTSYMTAIPDVYSPMGALNSFVSFQWNFGVIGTAGFMFALGYFLGRMQRRRGLWSRVAYVLISGWLAFTFFRDPFSVALVKNMLEFSLILPAVIIGISRWAVYAVASVRHPATAGAP